jgi:hypothetical protein
MVNKWASPDLNIFSTIETQLKHVNSELKLSHAPKILKLCMRLDFNILNNFLHWVDFKFSTEFLLKILEQIPI